MTTKNSSKSTIQRDALDPENDYAVDGRRAMKNPERGEPRPIFEWADNSVQESLKRLRKGETEYDGKQKIGEIMDEVANSHLFWKMHAQYETAHDECKGDGSKEINVLLALLARMYIAGSLLSVPVIENI